MSSWAVRCQAPPYRVAGRNAGLGGSVHAHREGLHHCAPFQGHVVGELESEGGGVDDGGAQAAVAGFPGDI